MVQKYPDASEKLLKAAEAGGQDASSEIGAILKAEPEHLPAQVVFSAIEKSMVRIDTPSGADDLVREEMNRKRLAQSAILYSLLKYVFSHKDMSSEFAEGAGLSSALCRAASSGLRSAYWDIFSFAKRDQTGAWKKSLSAPDGVAKAFRLMVASEPYFFSAVPFDIFFDAVNGDEVLSRSFTHGFAEAFRVSAHKGQMLPVLLGRACRNEFIKDEMSKGVIVDVFDIAAGISKSLRQQAGFMIMQVPQWRAAVYRPS